MKILTILLTLLFIWIDIKFQIRNSILLMEIMFLTTFYFTGRYATRTLRHRKLKRTALKSDRGYRNPKEIKNWREYTSKTQIQTSKTEDLFDRISIN